MMESRPSPRRLQRLREIAQDVGAVLQDDLTPLSPLWQITHLRTPDDERKADAVLGQLRIEETVAHSQPKGLKKAFSTNKRQSPYTQQELFGALTRVIDENGIAGVADVLLDRLKSLGGNPNLARRASTSIFKKITHGEIHDERGRLLQTATEKGRLDFVQVLVSCADTSSLDESLFIALEKKETAIAEILMRYGADSALCPAQFQAAIGDGDSDTVALFLRAPKRIAVQFLTEGLLPATISGSVRTVQLLAQAGADGEHEHASALMYAVDIGRIDLVTAIVMGTKPPSPKSLDRAIEAVFSTVTGSLQDKHLLTEVLLCGGAVGNAANEGLFKATMLVNIEMIQLLKEYGADVNYNNAFAVGHAIQRNRVDLVGLLLHDQTLRPEIASEAVGRISRTAPSAVRVAILSMLLLYGASGTYCNEILIAAAENDDIETARLLVSFGKDQNKDPVVSVDYLAARCLQIAVSRNNHMMVDLLTAEGRPSKFSLSKAFPLVSQANEETRFLIIQSLLNAGAEGTEVDAALSTALSSRHLSNRLIELLVRGRANTNGQTISMAVSLGRPDILQILLLGDPSAQTCSAAIPAAMKLQNKKIRYQTIKILLPYASAVGDEDTTIAQAVIDILESAAEDVELLKLFCQQDTANINFENGKAVILALQHADISILDIVLGGASMTESTTSEALACALQLPLADRFRCWKVEAILRRNKSQTVLNNSLIREIQLVRSVKGDLSVLQKLLTAGADVNAAEGAPVCFAVKDANIMDLLLARRPTRQTLSMALPLAMTLEDPTRYDLCEKLLKAGAAGDEISKALIAATKEGPSALPLMRLLLPQADVNYNEGRALRFVVRRAFLEGLDLLLTQRPNTASIATKKRAFQEAMNIKTKQDRYVMVKRLLAAGAKGDIVSDALVTAANNADLPLADLLLKSGASLDHMGGQAVLSAASSGNASMLKLLVGGTHNSKPSLSTLTTGYGGAMSLKDRDGDSYFLILKILLEVGLKGESVDAALVEAVRAGDSNLHMTELIYSNGASIEWQDGEAIYLAIRSGSTHTLSILLASCPSQSILKRAYKSALTLARDQRYLVIERIMKAGKSIDKHVTNTLLHAAKEVPADHDLIKLLLSYQIFDEGQGMAHAVSQHDLGTLSLLIESPKARTYTSSIFHHAFKTGAAWESTQGISLIRLMLDTGVDDEAISEAVVITVERCGSPDDASAEDCLNLLLRYKFDPNYQQGIILQRASQQANLNLIKKLLPAATSESKAMALPYLFKSSSQESLILQIIEAFSESSDGDQMLDVNFKHPDHTLEPVLFMALNMFPRKTQVLKALLDAGFSPEQWKLSEVDPEIGPEHLTILFWAIYQPEKRVSGANISLLINAGANVNFSTKSLVTPVMLSIMNQRPDVLEMLISKGAKVTASDDTGTSPLALASQTGNFEVMSHLLKAGAEVDDGSLHDAARELRCDAIRILIEHGHDLDYPSDRHDGRSALAELCFKAVDNGPNPDLEEAIQCLIANSTDFRAHFARGKTIFHYALDSSDPLTILKALLKALWKVINDECFLFKDESFTYSLTKYVEKGLSLGPAAQNREVIHLLQNSRATDRFWAHSIDAVQPVDYCGAPQNIEEEVLRQKVREKRKNEMRDDFRMQVEMKRYVATEESKLLQIQTDEESRREMEKARTRGHIAEMQADQQLRLENRAEVERQRLARIRQVDEMRHVKAIGESQISSQRAIVQAKIEMEHTDEMLQSERLEARISKENDAVRTRLAIENNALEERDRLLTKQHEREMSRMKTQRALVDQTQVLANNLRNTGANQRQIGYIMGEV